MALLLDTNIIVDYLRQHPPAIALVAGIRGKPYVSVATAMELYAGASSRSDERRIEQILASSNVLVATLEIARAAGQHVKNYKAAHGLDDLDALIAATAEHHGLTLATLNVKHFPMFRRLKAAY